MSIIAVGFLLAATAGFFDSGANAQSGSQRLSALEVQNLFYGKTMTGEYADGQAWAEQFGTDGTSQYSQNGRVFKGKMSMKGNSICFEYAPDTGFTGGCFEVWKRSANCFDFYSTTDGENPSASENQKLLGQAWDARAWYPESKSTCVTELIS